jgi:hypothetical protein
MWLIGMFGLWRIGSILEQIGEELSEIADNVGESFDQPEPIPVPINVVGGRNRRGMDL